MKPQAQIIITLFEGGNLNLQAPVSNKLLCYGMLEMAREIITKTDVQAQPQIQVVPAMPGINGGRKQ